MNILKSNPMISEDGVEYFETEENFVVVSKLNPKTITVNNSIYTNSGMLWDNIGGEEETFYIFR